MKKNRKVLILSVFLVIAFSVIYPFVLHANSSEVKLDITLKGVENSKITITPLAEQRPIFTGELKRDASLTIEVDPEHLPGEFLLSFEFNIQGSGPSRPQTSEKMLILFKDDVELWVNPMFINNKDSTFFGKNERENTVFLDFMQKNIANSEMIDLLQKLLINYDNRESDFYQHAIEEYENRVTIHNQLIDDLRNKHSDLFTASLIQLYYIPKLSFTGGFEYIQYSRLESYFSKIDFNDTMLLRSASLRPWMDNYVNMHIDLSKGRKDLDSLFVVAGFNAIENAKKGHPKFYGWMVDYFFQGYESLDIQEGIAMLAPYIADPNCLTERRQEIERRIQGITTLVPGAPAPNFYFKDENNEEQDLWSYSVDTDYKLVLFWSAGCPHCVETAKRLYNWYDKYEGNKKKFKIFAISLDEHDDEVEKWRNHTLEFEGWQHILADGGINSRKAYSYFILSTPTMFVVEPDNNTIVAVPSNLGELLKVLD